MFLLAAVDPAWSWLCRTEYVLPQMQGVAPELCTPLQWQFCIQILLSSARPPLLCISAICRTFIEGFSLLFFFRLPLSSLWCAPPLQRWGSSFRQCAFSSIALPSIVSLSSVAICSFFDLFALSGRVRINKSTTSFSVAMWSLWDGCSPGTFKCWLERRIFQIQTGAKLRLRRWQHVKRQLQSHQILTLTPWKSA